MTLKARIPAQKFFPASLRQRCALEKKLLRWDREGAAKKNNNLKFLNYK